MLVAIAFLGGVLTILSPCILPILPFVFTRTGRPFMRNGLPLLAGMAVMFAAVATLAAVGGSWVVRANEWGRWLAIALMIVFGFALLLPTFASRLMQPVVALGNRLSSRERNDGSVGSSLILIDSPGGKIEAGERPEQTLIRELNEELGIVVQEPCLAPLTFASHAYPEFHLLMPLYVCRRWEGIVTAREGQRLAWVRPQRLRDYPMPPADEPLVAHLTTLL